MPSAPENLRITSEFCLRLCAALRASGVQVGTQQAMACLSAALLLGAFVEEELRGICRSTLVNRRQDLHVLDSVFTRLLREFSTPDLPENTSTEERARKTIVAKTREYADRGTRDRAGEEEAHTEGYSVREVDHLKDFRLIDRRDIGQYVAELTRLARRCATLSRRKTRRSRRTGRVDLRASIRESVKYDGEIIRLRFKRKVPTHSRFVLVCDVSGSMEIYAVFLLNFLHHLYRLRKIRAESFVFSTRLQSLTKEFRSRAFPEMLRNVSRNFTGWSGGTKIGAALQCLNDTHATSVTAKTTVLIMSDGWDTGDTSLLEREMARLERRARAIIWINPLKGDADYEPLAAGMAAARPYCRYFVAGHSIESFAALARMIGPAPLRA